MALFLGSCDVFANFRSCFAASFAFQRLFLVILQSSISICSLISAAFSFCVGDFVSVGLFVCMAVSGLSYFAFLSRLSVGTELSVGRTSFSAGPDEFFATQ